MRGGAGAAMERSDVIILGAGMAGSSLAAELGSRNSVLLLEAEDQPGRHSTGRSAAMFLETYGNAAIRALTRASRAFYDHPPAGFTDVALLAPRGCLFVADTGQLELLDAILAEPDMRRTSRRLDVGEALRRVPILDPAWLAGAVLDESGFDIDVAALHQGYLRMAKRAGVRLVTGAGAALLERHGALWQVRSAAGDFEAPVVVDAAGAWADQVALQAGVRPVGLQPLRRTAMMLPAPPGHDIRGWPLVVGAAEDFYFKPDAGQLLLSPANEDPMPPCDVAPEELDIAIAVDRFERATTVHVQRVARRWAGLRSFVADRTPVVGFDDAAAGFFWLAGQGGYGIQTAPAMARAAAALVRGEAIPADIAAEGVRAEALAPGRDALAPARAGRPAPA
ncbi:MAG: FAD-binding oxidoreductase [Betaproteobacteria bacterium]|nr:FAD-binding oxidoreductase [Betaproteobacteria bacterium]